MDTLAPSQTKVYKDTEGGSDFKVVNPTDSAGAFNFTIDTGAPRSHSIAAHGSWYTEIPDRQSGTITNTGSVTLNAQFGSGVS
ncbi:MAG TPA: hypothetical protein VHU87_11380 [Rhizomicrobium sp.]|jgi:hypothetical protein|nr:hypothetical protein [Rhizomicrobium sp.]